MMDEHGRIADFVLVVDSKRMMPNLLGLAGWIHTSATRNLEWGSVISTACEYSLLPVSLLSFTLHLPHPLPPLTPANTSIFFPLPSNNLPCLKPNGPDCVTRLAYIDFNTSAPGFRYYDSKNSRSEHASGQIQAFTGVINATVYQHCKACGGLGGGKQERYFP